MCSKKSRGAASRAPASAPTDVKLRPSARASAAIAVVPAPAHAPAPAPSAAVTAARRARSRSEEHTSELQSLAYLVCRLLLEKKKAHYRVGIAYLPNKIKIYATCRRLPHTVYRQELNPTQSCPVLSNPKIMLPDYMRYIRFAT